VQTCCLHPVPSPPISPTLSYLAVCVHMNVCLRGIIIIYLLVKQIQICCRGLHIAGTTRLKFSTNSRPKGNITATKKEKYKHKIRIWDKTQEIDMNNAVNICLKMAPVCREQLCEIKKATEINTFNCTLKCGKWKKINSVAWQTIPNVNNPFSKKWGPDIACTLVFKQLVGMASSCLSRPQLKKSHQSTYLHNQR